MNEEEDDWQPDFEPETILKKTVVRFSNKRVEENLKQFNSQPDAFKDDHDSDEERQGEPQNMMFEAQGLRNKQTGETLYDPLKDDRCESWTNTNLNSGKYCKPLSCPGCFTPVCYSYEQHPQHEGQYYSPTIRNCEINYSKLIEADPAPVTVPNLSPVVLSQLEDNQLSDLAGSLQQQQSSYNVYFPVHCGQCNHQLAMYDVDRKTYHLYSVV